MSQASPCLRGLVIFDTVDMAPTSMKTSQSLDREHRLMPVVNVITQNSLAEREVEKWKGKAGRRNA